MQPHRTCNLAVSASGVYQPCQCLTDLLREWLDGVSRAGSNVAVQDVLSKSIQSVDIRAGLHGGGAVEGEDQPFCCCTVPRDVRVLTMREM